MVVDGWMGGTRFGGGLAEDMRACRLGYADMQILYFMDGGDG